MANLASMGREESRITVCSDLPRYSKPKLNFDKPVANLTLKHTLVDLNKETARMRKRIDKVHEKDLEKIKKKPQSSLRSVENVDAYEPVVTEQSVKEAEERLAYLNNRLGAKAEFKGSLFKPLILPDNVIDKPGGDSADFRLRQLNREIGNFEGQLAEKSYYRRSQQVFGVTHPGFQAFGAESNVLGSFSSMYKPTEELPESYLTSSAGTSEVASKAGGASEVASSKVGGSSEVVGGASGGGASGGGSSAGAPLAVAGGGAVGGKK